MGIIKETIFCKDHSQKVIIYIYILIFLEILQKHSKFAKSICFWHKPAKLRHLCLTVWKSYWFSDNLMTILEMFVKGKVIKFLIILDSGIIVVTIAFIPSLPREHFPSYANARVYCVHMQHQYVNELLWSEEMFALWVQMIWKRSSTKLHTSCLAE